ncbi:AzlC family ABC transporter permease [Atopobiaceae bacterium 24-176]
MTDAVHRAFPAALPVMLGYLVIGVPAGILEAEIGLSPWMAFMVSCTYYSGAGQFMLPNLWLAGQGFWSIGASISLVNMRQLLYSAAFAPRMTRVPKPLKALFAATVTDESFGVNMERFGADKTWDASCACAVNVLSMLSWAFANAVGAAVGDVLAMPTEVASFAMTSIFICLLLSQSFTRPLVACAVTSAAVVAICKLVGASSIAVVCGALAGVVVATALGQRSSEGHGAKEEGA